MSLGEKGGGRQVRESDAKIKRKTNRATNKPTPKRNDKRKKKVSGWVWTEDKLLRKKPEIAGDRQEEKKGPFQKGGGVYFKGRRPAKTEELNSIKVLGGREKDSKCLGGRLVEGKRVQEFIMHIGAQRKTRARPHKPDHIQGGAWGAHSE